MVKVVNLRYEKADIRVCRPGPFGNPYTHLVLAYGQPGIHVRDRSESILRFAIYFYSERGRGLREKALAEISSEAKIGCWCAPVRCHGDIIAGYLNWKRGNNGYRVL